MLLLLISFIGGILTVLAPCILPLLPVIVGGSLSSGSINKRKALTVIISLGISVIAFTLLLKVSTLFIEVPEYSWKLISGGIILFFGIITIFPSFWENPLLAKLNIKSNMLLGKGEQKKSFWGDVIIGAALGPVFSACSPTYFIILATVLPAQPVIGLIYLLTYAIGLCLALLLVVLIGQRIMTRLGIVADPRGWFKRILGILFILVAVAILTGYDKKLQISILDSGFLDVTKIEQKLLEGNTSSYSNDITTIGGNLDEINQENKDNAVSKGIQKDNEDKAMTFLTEKQKQTKYIKAPEISSPDGFINTNGEPVTLASLRGKVVLLDIWTYSCINCQRTIPYINNWYAKYKDDGFVVVGLHTPEFSFEKVQSNVEKAVKEFGIKYPVVLDNDFSTWQALGNQYWPRKYLIDIDGYIVYDHIGEGGYAETEKEIQKTLEERAYRMGINNNISTNISNPDNVISVNSSMVNSPEIYFGSDRNSFLANGHSGSSGEQSLVLPGSASPNSLYLGGTWNFTREYAENKNAGDIVFRYDAKNVYMVANSEGGIDVQIYKDDSLVKTVNIKDEKLYNLIEGDDYGAHTLHIKIPSGGLRAFTFTFG